MQSLNISLEDFSKISILIEHADFHQEKYGDTFLDFISEHYGSANFDHGTEHEEHEELPFKHDHQTCHHNSPTFTITTLTFEIKQQKLIESSSNFFYKEPHSLFEKPSVFQPPKQA
ncbi:hypothetical protein [Pontimicrobium sp. IMCC45349]|uniref:hypothetical protein n=1 Tax=Pontimicrobium sp. IMCC45349 TaxID=3391574 RepID=UPI0039A37ADE